jgi:hypothetical protein
LESRQVDNYVNIIATSNRQIPFKIDKCDRRWQVHYISYPEGEHERKSHIEKVKTFNEWLENEVSEALPALRYYLIADNKWESYFQVGKVLKTDAKEHLIDASESLLAEKLSRLITDKEWDKYPYIQLRPAYEGSELAEELEAGYDVKAVTIIETLIRTLSLRPLVKSKRRLRVDSLQVGERISNAIDRQQCYLTPFGLELGYRSNMSTTEITNKTEELLRQNIELSGLLPNLKFQLQGFRGDE